MDPFESIWTYLDLVVQFGPTKSLLKWFGTKLNPFGPILTYLDLFGPSWTNLVPFGAIARPMKHCQVEVQEKYF